jgi:hypothetical protein
MMRIAAAGVFFDCHADHAALFKARQNVRSVQTQRRCRQHASIAASPPACIHCGIAASMHSHNAACRLDAWQCKIMHAYSD